MSPALLGASVVASFLGGVLALMAPCCISFLFPAYFASAFKRKTKILQMTMIYFLGLALVIVPISLGVSFLARTFARYHNEVFLIGGIFLIFLAILTFFGKTIPMPIKVKPNLQKSDPLSIFILGILSGVASSCCTPVLVGVLTITALSGTFLYALLLSLTYVLGMVFPLVVLAWLWDRFDFSKSRLFQGKVFNWKIFKKDFYIHSTHLISAAILGIMGILIVVLTLTGRTSTSVAYLDKMTTVFGNITMFVLDKTKTIPEFIWIIFVILLLILILWQAFKPKKGEE